MDYTLSNAYTTDAGTGNRMHQQSAATTTAVTDQDMNSLIWELLSIIKAGGLAPVAFDKTVPATYTQVAAAIQSGKLFSAAAAGTADAITASFAPGIAVLKDGMALYVRGAAANATTTPTFTPASGTIAAKAIVKGAGAALAAGDIAGTGHWIELQYDLTLDKWVLLNPANGVSGGAVYASNAEAQALALTNKVISPATLAQALKGANQSLATNGYQKLPGGLIIQWGYVSSQTGQATVTWPIAFPNALFTAVSNVADSSGALTAIMTKFIQPSSGLTSGVFMLQQSVSNATAAGGYSWIAIGW